METIHLEKNGTLVKNDKKIVPPIYKYLGNTAVLNPDATLGSFFMMLEKYPDFFNISDMLKPLFEIAAESYAPGFKTDEIDHLVFYKTIEIKGFPGKPSLTLYNSLKGSINNTVVDLKFFHLETLLDHQLKLGNLEHVVFGDREDAFSFETFYTLFELIEGIGWELSFNFNPLECSIRR